ncbi:MAG TPA: metallophosphoesterase [Clostridia bacterium]|nr:metallophosphoesterase [Clostridia bacterium]
MKVFAISDLHLSTSVEKPMDIFGEEWQGHFEKIKTDWNARVLDEDIVLLGGDMSWGQTLDEAQSDFDLLKDLKGKKIVLRGNHDYWWSSLSKIKSRFPNFTFLQNNAVKIGNIIVAGTRGWSLANEKSNEEDKKIYARELLRLELSLKCATDKLNEGDILIALLHYPPFEVNFADTEITKLLEKYGVKFATYGHLHGKNVRVAPKLEKNNITYFLTSCDLINNTLVEVCEGF